MNLNLAVLLQGEAATGEVLVAERRQNNGGQFHSENLGLRSLKGFLAPVTAYRARVSRFAARCHCKTCREGAAARPDARGRRGLMLAEEIRKLVGPRGEQVQAEDRANRRRGPGRRCRRGAGPARANLAPRLQGEVSAGKVLIAEPAVCLLGAWTRQTLPGRNPLQCKFESCPTWGCLMFLDKLQADMLSEIRQSRSMGFGVHGRIQIRRSPSTYCS